MYVKLCTVYVCITGRLHVSYMQIRSTSDNSNLLGKSKKVRVIGSLKQITGKKKILSNGRVG